MMKQIPTAVLFLLLTLTSFGQVNYAGKVTNTAHEPIEGATLVLKNKNVHTTTTTRANGIFQFAGITPGEYQLSITAIGYETWQQACIITEVADSLREFQLKRQAQQLQTVEVLGRTSTGYTSAYSFSATRMAVANKELPQAITTVTKELISDRQAFQLADALKTASSVTATSYYNQFTIRGISQNEEGTIINGMRTRQYYFNQPLTANIERVEVIKGPASATFSSVDPGGTINLVTKKPLTIDKKEVSLSVGSFSTIRGSLDFTGPLNKEKTLLYRLNGAWQDAKSFRDLQFQKALLIAPSFSYIPTDRTSVNVELIYSNINTRLDRGQPIFGAVAGKTNLNSTPIRFNLGVPNDFFKSKEVIFQGNLAHKLTRYITFNTSYMKQTWTEDLQEHRTTNAFAIDINDQPIPTLAAMQMVQRQQNWNTDNLNSYFILQGNTGSIGHNLLVGFDLIRTHKLKGGGQNAARGYLLTNGKVASTYDPANQSQYQLITQNGIQMPRPNVDHFNLVDPAYTIRNVNDYVFTKSALSPALIQSEALYVQEQLKWKRFTMLLSLRADWFTDITNYRANNTIKVKQFRAVPRAGITYTVSPAVNVYATYLEGFQPQANTVTLIPVAAPAGSTFDPITSDLKEAGVKATVFKSIQVNVAIFEVNQRNLLMNANDPANPDLLVSRGAERSRGFEMDIAGFIVPYWQFNASYSYIDATIRNDRDKSLIGARKQNTPIHSGNIWTRYNFEQVTLLRDIGIGAGMQYSGDKVPWFTRSFTIPAYTLLDAAIYYTPSKSNLQLALNINNVLDEEYWIGAQNYLRLFPGAPRNILFTATYKF
ncbi:TonB-dependent receptor [Paraflavitalea sp. CAU 1676]|uniref:TonB-dependent receptor n=1 Tax=Paraflavitalea sp. CAU 1676 TaxID=3032598 RepID=UPI0023DB00F0|nr:TonB-dependent receptor [Paraflavitalea sp. CAU 1676]MDF2192040.1 TonB-dependent receptor [Paraflavitalea sp. CAU 1676]